jgi:hypothetical protein
VADDGLSKAFPQLGETDGDMLCADCDRVLGKDLRARPTRRRRHVDVDDFALTGRGRRLVVVLVGHVVCPAGSSLTPRATIPSAPSGSGRCSFRVSSGGAVIQVSTSSGVVRITGIAFGWIAPTSAFGSVVSSGLYRLFASRMRGYDDAQARLIFRDLIDMPADVIITDDEITVRLHRSAHLPIVLASGILDKPVAVPWWNGRYLHFVQHRPAGARR